MKTLAAEYSDIENDVLVGERPRKPISQSFRHPPRKHLVFESVAGKYKSLRVDLGKKFHALPERPYNRIGYRLHFGSQRCFRVGGLHMTDYNILDDIAHLLAMVHNRKVK